MFVDRLLRWDDGVLFCRVCCADFFRLKHLGRDTLAVLDSVHNYEVEDGERFRVIYVDEMLECVVVGASVVYSRRVSGSQLKAMGMGDRVALESAMVRRTGQGSGMLRLLKLEVTSLEMECKDD